MPLSAKTALCSILAGASLSYCAVSSAYFADVTIYDNASGDFLGVVENGSASLEYANQLSLNIMPTVNYDWIRMSPINSDCGSERQYERGSPVEMTLSPKSADSECEVELEAMVSPGRSVDSMTVVLSFEDGGSSGSGGGSGDNGGSSGSSGSASSDIADVAIFSGANGNYLGEVSNGSATVAYSSELSLEIVPSVTYDWIRMSPTNSACGNDKQYESGDPIEMTLEPNSVNSQCKFDIDAMVTPGRVSSSMSVVVNFDGSDSGSDPVPDPDPGDSGGSGGSGGSSGGSSNKSFANSDRIEFTQGTSDSKDYNVGNVVGRSAHGNRIFCVVSHLSYDDPIVYPGLTGAAHLHMFWGNTGTDAYSTPESLPLTGRSSCEGGTNYRAGLWIPALYNSKNEVVVPDETFIYYKKFGSDRMNFNHLQVVPQGLEMLASKDTFNYGVYGTSLLKAESITKDGKNVLRMDLSFPSCVATHDGTRTGTPLLSYKEMPGAASKVINSHVAYPGGEDRNSVDCPPSHPYGFPTPSAILVFDQASVGNNPYVSSDKMLNAPNMSTLHADYVFGMDTEVSEQMLKCTKEARNCRFDITDGNLRERFYDSEGTEVYQYNSLAPGYDTTPFGDDLAPMLH